MPDENFSYPALFLKKRIYIMEKSDVVIIGGVACGCKAAATLARRNPNLKITLFQKEDDLSYATCGLPYFASGDVDSFRALTETSYNVVRDVEYFRKSKGIKAVTESEVIEINRNEKKVKVKDLKKTISDLEDNMFALAQENVAWAQENVDLRASRRK